MQYKIDETARALAAGASSRRGVLKTIFAGALVAAGVVQLSDAEAKGGKGKKGKGKKGKGKGNGNGNGHYGACPGGTCSEYNADCGYGCTCVFKNENSYEGTCELICPEHCPCGCEEYTNECISEYECPVYCSGTCSEYDRDCGYGCKCDLNSYSPYYEQCREKTRS